MPVPPIANKIRSPVPPADIPPEKVARRLGLTLAKFNEVLPNLRKREFPLPDPDTGNYGLDAVDLWRNRRDRILPELTAPPLAGDDGASLVERLHATKQRQAANRGRNCGAA
jgi:hypothetical protein